jgi:hypothetical protein
MCFKCLFLTFESAINILKPGDCPLWRDSSLWAGPEKSVHSPE